MYLIGYHGTSEDSAVSLLATGPRASGKWGEVGQGFYVARENGGMVDFYSYLNDGGSNTSPPRASEPDRSAGLGPLLHHLKGSHTVLKVYSTVELKNLKNCRWNISDVSGKRALTASDATGVTAPSFHKGSLQMVIPEEYFQYIKLKRSLIYDDDEAVVAWPAGLHAQAQHLDL